MSYERRLGSRILQEANDLKRTVSSMAQELGVEVDWVTQITQGQATRADCERLIQLMGEYYPIDPSQLWLVEDECTYGVRIMRAEQSKQTARVFQRKNASGEKSPYYEYRDTAMARLSPFKPEWIKELRVVSNEDPYHPDVAYNKGHFLHQLTFFVGEVNFYWEVEGKKFCRKMNTGDSNYITPYWPHSFTSRNPKTPGLILALTFGGHVQQAQKELYSLGPLAKGYISQARDPQKAQKHLLIQYFKNANFSLDNVQSQLNQIGSGYQIKSLLASDAPLPQTFLEQAAIILNVPIQDLSWPEYTPEEEVVVKHAHHEDPYEYPSKEAPRYAIKPLAQTLKLPQMKGFDIQVVGHDIDKTALLEASLHTYLYNYGAEPITFYYVSDQGETQTELAPGDSAYVQPFVACGFSCQSQNGRLLMARVQGAMHLSCQKEWSSFSDPLRVLHETGCWFD